MTPLTPRQFAEWLHTVLYKSPLTNAPASRREHLLGFADWYFDHLDRLQLDVIPRQPTKH
jgi:hypothetical protein